MLNHSMLENFPIPEFALEDIKKANLKSTNLDDGVDMFMAHDKGVAFRFFNHAEYNKKKSEELGYEKFDDIPMIEWFVDKRTKIPERIALLPKEHLEFEMIPFDVTWEDEKGITRKRREYKPNLDVCIGGKYMDAYQKWQKGLKTPGLPLTKWGVLSDGECATLAAVGIFTVEQLAAQPRSKIEGKNYPLEIIEGFERAIQYVAGKMVKVEHEKHTAEILALKKEAAEKDAAFRALQEQVAALTAERSSAPAKVAKKSAKAEKVQPPARKLVKRGRPRKLPLE